MNMVQTPKIDVAFVHDIEGSGLEYRWWFRNLSGQSKKFDNDDPVLRILDVQEEKFRQLTFGDDPDITPAWSR